MVVSDLFADGYGNDGGSIGWAVTGHRGIWPPPENTG